MASKLRWSPAPFDVEVIDIWPPGRFTQAVRDAYDTLAQRGRLRPVGCKRDAVGRVYVKYLADIPEQWIHEELKEAKYAGRQVELREVKIE